MSKKHFIRLAEYIRDTGRYREPFTDRQIEHLANFCHEMNRHFLGDRWVDYIKGQCGPNGGKQKCSHT